MNERESVPQDDPAVLQLLELQQATFKKSKSGKVLLVDLQAAQEVTDEMVSQLTGLPKLRELNLAGCPVSDAIGASLRQFKNIRTLDLQRTAVSDAILDDLQDLASLQLLDLSGTRVTSERVRAARKLMIGTRIVHLDA